MKKLLTVLCTFLLALSIASFGPVKAQAETCPFTDIGNTTEKPELRDAVTYLYCNGITAGTSATTFSPNQPVTRAQFVTFLWTMAGSPSIITTNPFEDVSTTDYYYKAVQWAVANGVTSGTSSTTFSPNKNVSYQEIFTFIHVFSSRVVGRESAVRSTYALSKPSNLNKYSSWAKSHAEWAYKNGIVYHAQAYSNLFTPKNSATRGDVAMFLYNYYRSFQNRYALIVGNNREGGTWKISDANINRMRNCLNNMTMKKLLAYNSVKDSTEFAYDMSNAFSEATCIDICYFYASTHGDTRGLVLFYSNTDSRLTPALLDANIKKYQGHFIVMIDSCYSGVFAERFAGSSDKKVDILTAADRYHKAYNISSGEMSDLGGFATITWTNYLTPRINNNQFISLNQLWENTKDRINQENVQNPQIYSYVPTYIAFTNKLY